MTEKLKKLYSKLWWKYFARPSDYKRLADEMYGKLDTIGDVE